MDPIDLAQIALVDNHCHGLYHAQGPFDAVGTRALFTESYGATLAHSRHGAG